MSSPFSASAREAGRYCVWLWNGRLPGMISDPIRFRFDLYSRGTALDGAKPRIAELEGRGHCSACGAEPALTVAFAPGSGGGEGFAYLRRPDFGQQPVADVRDA